MVHSRSSPPHPGPLPRLPGRGNLLLCRALQFPLLVFLILPRKAQPAMQVMKNAVHFAGCAAGGGGDAADAVVEEMPLEADLNEFGREAQRALQKRNHQRMRKPAREHGY